MYNVIWIEMKSIFSGMLAGALLMLVLLGIAVCLHPSAMDVYQGKTRIEVKYRDGVAVDSTVVFKRMEE